MANDEKALPEVPQERPRIDKVIPFRCGTVRIDRLDHEDGDLPPEYVFNLGWQDQKSGRTAEGNFRIPVEPGATISEVFDAYPAERQKAAAFLQEQCKEKLIKTVSGVGIQQLEKNKKNGRGRRR